MQDLVSFTEDIAIHRPLGCDAINVFDGANRNLLHLGKLRPSLGRMGAVPDLRL
jgi:hypothetical protein